MTAVLLSLSLLLIPPPPSSPLFPYTTLFRSQQLTQHSQAARSEALGGYVCVLRARGGDVRPVPGVRRRRERSEEHTSELQSRFDLVCRLLLEKKNNKYTLKQ